MIDIALAERDEEFMPGWVNPSAPTVQLLSFRTKHSGVRNLGKY